MQVHSIFIKQNFLADILSRCQYAKIANKYSFLQIIQSISKISLKAGI